MLAPGDQIPNFSLKQTDGKVVNSSDLLGKRFVLYFYPEDDTPGCTKQACSLRDSYQKFLDKGVLVYGISPDGIESHKKFTEKFNLPFPLLADEGHKLADEFGVWGEKNNYGRTYMGIIRTTFVINERGKIAEVLTKINTEKHADELMQYF